MHRTPLVSDEESFLAPPGHPRNRDALRSVPDGPGIASGARRCCAFRSPSAGSDDPPPGPPHVELPPNMLRRSRSARGRSSCRPRLASHSEHSRTPGDSAESSPPATRGWREGMRLPILGPAESVTELALGDLPRSPGLTAKYCLGFVLFWRQPGSTGPPAPNSTRADADPEGNQIHCQRTGLGTRAQAAFTPRMAGVPRVWMTVDIGPRVVAAPTTQQAVESWTLGVRALCAPGRCASLRRQ